MRMNRWSLKALPKYSSNDVLCYKQPRLTYKYNPYV